jgi:heptosyltransferase-2
MAIPAMAAVRHAFEGRSIVLAALPSIAPLFEEITPAAPDEILAVERERERAQLQATNADGILLLPNSFGSAWTARRSGITDRWGYAVSGRRFLLTRTARRSFRAIHQVQYYLDLVRGLGIEAGDDRPRLQAHAATLAKVDALLLQAGASPGTQLVGFAPGAAYGHAKRWPPDRVAQVIAGLAQQGIAAVLVGAGADRATGRAIESTLPAATPLVNLIGRTTLRQLVGVIARCRAFVSNDSGAMHVAAALGVPLTAIFGPTDERATRPAGNADVMVRDVFCRPCMLRECPIDHRCMKRIDAASVLQSVMAHLG